MDLSENMYSKASKEFRVLSVLKTLTREYGRCSFSLDTISQLSGIPKLDLWDCDAETGLLREMSDDGCVCVERARDPAVGLDSEVLC